MSDVVDDLGVPYFPEGGSYQQFIEQHLLSNQPCLFGEWATRNWGARKDWVLKDGLPNLDYFRNEFGTPETTTAKTRAKPDFSFSAQVIQKCLWPTVLSASSSPILKQR